MICDCAAQVHIRDVDCQGGQPVMVRFPATGPSQQIQTTFTRCGFGGRRAWFSCPCCGRRCAILYAYGRLACRLCHNGRYAVEHEGRFDRTLRKAFKHRARFGMLSGGVVSPFPDKPKLMRWHTYLEAFKTDQQNLRDVMQNFTMPRR